MKQVLIIVGPTASGKNDLALDIAGQHAGGGVLINADSMQIYEELQVVTARPDADEVARAPHKLFAATTIDAPWGAAAWREAALAEIDAAHHAGMLPILVGGTGFYLTSLIDGLSPIPDIPEEIRMAETEKLETIGSAAYHADMAGRDPEMAAKLHPNDTQRLIRAGEVLAATGKSLAYWQNLPRIAAPDDLSFKAVLMMPPREVLYPRIDFRFERMMQQGALDEVKTLKAKDYDRDLPGMRAVGVAELLDYLDGACTLDEAIEAAQRESRRYAKRQLTWLRNQMTKPRENYDYSIIESLYNETLVGMLSDFI